MVDPKAEKGLMTQPAIPTAFFVVSVDDIFGGFSWIGYFR